jgi:SOS response regulatory protein OraA/RecX
MIIRTDALNRTVSFRDTAHALNYAMQGSDPSKGVAALVLLLEAKGLIDEREIANLLEEFDSSFATYVSVIK